MIQLHAARVGSRDSDTIVVLRDMSRLRRLERMRSDFVSNVSHELRTPLASIAAAVETLQDAEARTDPDTGPSFVEMVRRNVSRLEALLDDILALSRFESRPEGIRVLGDAEALRRIVDNLILNAITYTSREGRVAVAIRQQGDEARSRSAGGTGLGLAIVKHAVGLHAGSIEVESEPGASSTFLVRFPIVAPDNGDEYSSASEAGTVDS